MTNETTQTWPEWTDRVIDSRGFGGREYGPKATIQIEAGLHYLQGNSAPYFSLTGEIRTKRRGDCEACGQLHREILSVAPEFKIIADLHLSDIDGKPMHASSNGWYRLAGYYGGAGQQYHAGNGKRQHWTPDGEFNGYRESTPDECLQSFAEHARISIDEARRLADSWLADAEAAEAARNASVPARFKTKTFPKWQHVQCLYQLWMTAQEPRWKAEADEAREWLRAHDRKLRDASAGRS